MNKKSRKSLNDSIVSEAESSFPAFELHNLFKLHTYHSAAGGEHLSDLWSVNQVDIASIDLYFLSSILDSLNIPAAEFLATKSLERCRGISERDFDTLNSLNALQSIYNGAKSKNLRVLDNNMMKEFTIISNAFIDALRSYASRLSLHTPTKYNAALECKILSEEMTKTNITNETTPTLDEKLIYERQMLAVIALLCTDYPNTTHSLLFEKCDEVSANDNDDVEMDGDNRIGSFVDILADVLCNIGHSVSNMHKNQHIFHKKWQILEQNSFFPLENTFITQKPHRIGITVAGRISENLYRHRVERHANHGPVSSNCILWTKFGFVEPFIGIFRNDIRQSVQLHL